VAQPFFSAGQQDQLHDQNFTFNMNMWTNDYTAIDDWTGLNGSADMNT